MELETISNKLELTEVFFTMFHVVNICIFGHTLSLKSQALAHGGPGSVMEIVIKYLTNCTIHIGLKTKLQSKSIFDTVMGNKKRNFK